MDDGKNPVRIIQGRAGFFGKHYKITLRSVEPDQLFIDKPSEYDIAFSTRKAQNQETSNIKKDPHNSFLKDDVLAVTAIAVVVHETKNKLEALAIEKLRGIISGDITKWKELDENYKDNDIRILMRNGGLRSFETVEKNKLFKQNALSAPSQELEAQEFEDDWQVLKEVEEDESVIGLVEYPYLIKGEQDKKVKYHVLKIAHENISGMPTNDTCIKPQEDSIRSKKYCLTNNVYLYYVRKNHTNEHAEDFVHFTSSPTSRKSIEKAQYVAAEPVLPPTLTATPVPMPTPISKVAPSPLTMHSPPKLPKRPVAEWAKNNGMSCLGKVYFEPGEYKLDNPNKERLNQIMTDYGNPVNTTLWLALVGYADEEGKNANYNDWLSKARALTISEMIKEKLGNVPMRAEGLGILRDKDGGRTENRRVEIWVQASPGTSRNPDCPGPDR
ncbi:MAG: substrate-binding domain-containing protein [Deltaproteobacteria bacterium]|nr:substrate-binding domain-containing protein [Deltaproteobacteria bacterium]